MATESNGHGQSAEQELNGHNSEHSSSVLLPNDDFFGDQESSLVNEEERRRRELDALRRPHYTAGVRHAVSSSHESNVQGGFDDGFLQAAKTFAEPAFLYGAASTALAFYARQGCTPRTETRVQTVDDTEVPTSYLKNVHTSVMKLRADIRQLPMDGTLSSDHAVDSLRKVTLVRIPPDLSSNQPETEPLSSNNEAS